MLRQPENIFCVVIQPSCKPLPLARWTIKRAALSDNSFNNRRAAVGAGLVGFAVHFVFLLEIAAFAFAVHKIAQGAAASLNRAAQDLFDGGG